MRTVERTTVATATAAAAAAAAGPKRLHFSNLPFRLREADLRALLAVILSNVVSPPKSVHVYHWLPDSQCG